MSGALQRIHGVGRFREQTSNSLPKQFVSGTPSVELPFEAGIEEIHWVWPYALVTDGDRAFQLLQVQDKREYSEPTWPLFLHSYVCTNGSLDERPGVGHSVIARAADGVVPAHLAERPPLLLLAPDHLVSFARDKKGQPLLLRTIDGGKTWSQTPIELRDSIYPKDATRKVALAAVRLHDGSLALVFRTSIPKPPPAPLSGMVPTHTARYFLTISADAGRTWQPGIPIGEEQDDTSGTEPVRIATAGPTIVVSHAVPVRFPVQNTINVAVSTDTGKTWHRVPLDGRFDGHLERNELVVSPDGTRILLAANVYDHEGQKRRHQLVVQEIAVRDKTEEPCKTRAAGPEATESSAIKTGVTEELPTARQPELKLPDSLPLIAMSSRVDTYGDSLPLGAIARMGTSRFRHPDVIRLLHYSPDGETLTSFSCPTRRVQSADADNPGLVRFWNIETGKVQGEFVFEPYHLPEKQTHSPPALFEMSVSADGKTLAICGKDIRIWDARKGVERLKLDRWGRAVLSPNGAVLAVLDYGDNGIALVDATSGKERMAIGLDDLRTGCDMAFSPDSRLLAVAAERRVRVWDWESGRQLHDFDLPGDFVRFSPDSNRLAASYVHLDADKGPQPMIRLWNVQSGEQLCTLEGEPLHHTLNDLTFSPDGQTLAAVGYHGQESSIDLWDVETGKQRRSLKTIWGLMCTAFSPDGSTLAVAGSRNIVQFWNVSSGTQRVSTQPDYGGIRTMAISPDGHTVATAAGDHTIRLWDAQNGEIRRWISGSEEQGDIDWLAFAPDGQRLASAGQQVRIWNPATGQSQKLHDQEGAPTSLAFNGQHLFAIRGQTLFQWDSLTGKKLPSWDRQEEQLPADRTHADPFGDTKQLALRAVALSPDVRLIASAIGPDSSPFAHAFDSPGGKIFLWDVQTKAKVVTIDAGQSRYSRSLTFSPDGRLMAWSGADFMVIYDTRRRYCLLTLGSQQLSGNQPSNAPIAFSPSGRIVAMAVDRDNIALWEVASGERLFELQGHNDRITSLAFSPNGKRLVSAAMDDMALVWDLPTASRELDPVDVAADDLDSVWSRLADKNAAKAFGAVWSLVQAGSTAVELITAKLADAKPTSEETNRPLTSEWQLQRLRAVQALELLGTPDSVLALQQLGKGPEAAVYVQEAKAAMNRIAEAERRSHAAARQAEDRVSRKLQSPVVIQFIQTPLADVVDYLRDLHRMEFQIAKGVRRDMPVTANLKEVTLAEALTKMLDPLKLTYRVTDGCVVIQPGKDANATGESEQQDESNTIPER